jgi:Ca2+-binding EF-hand superfamily protein
MFTMRARRALKLFVLVAMAAAAPGTRAATEPPAPSGKSDAPKGQMPSSGAAMMKMDPAKVFDMMDSDKKGYVTKEEFLKFQEQLFQTWDKDKSGRLTKPEFTDRG